MWNVSMGLLRRRYESELRPPLGQDSGGISTERRERDGHYWLTGEDSQSWRVRWVRHGEIGTLTSQGRTWTAGKCLDRHSRSHACLRRPEGENMCALSWVTTLARYIQGRCASNRSQSKRSKRSRRRQETRLGRCGRTGTNY